jgi:hypothetical protein
MLLAGCGADEASTAQPSATTTLAPAKATQDAAVAVPAVPAAGEATNEKIGLPIYPGAKEVESTRFGLHTGTGDTFTVSYRTSDSPTLVADYYRAEATKLGTLEESLNIGTELKSVAVKRPDGSTSGARAVRGENGVTIISVFRIFPAKR